MSVNYYKWLKCFIVPLYFINLKGKVQYMHWWTPILRVYIENKTKQNKTEERVRMLFSLIGAFRKKRYNSGIYMRNRKVMVIRILNGLRKIQCLTLNVASQQWKMSLSRLWTLFFITKIYVWIRKTEDVQKMCTHVKVRGIVFYEHIYIFSCWVKFKCDHWELIRFSLAIGRY